MAPLLFMQGTHYMEMGVQTPTKRYPCLTFLHGVDRTVVLSCFQVDSRPDGCRCRGSLCISIGPTTRLFLYRCTYTINCNLQGHLFKKKIARTPHSPTQPTPPTVHTSCFPQWWSCVDPNCSQRDKWRTYGVLARVAPETQPQRACLFHTTGTPLI